MNIQSVNSFLSKKAESLKSIKANVTVDGRGLLPRFFYRGQSNDFKSSNNVASIFRQKELSGYTHEYSFTNEYMRRYANDFNNLENNFSRLSYMQHFGLPTRLLDVTTNALVALYFACQSHLDSEGHETDGIVTMFFSNKTQNIDDLLKEDENHLYQSWYMDLVKQFPEGYYEQLSEENQKVYDSLNDFYKEINQSYEMQCLYHDIKRDTGYFADLINFRTLLHPFFVEPSINNERLRAQSGFFLFEPYDGTSCSLENIHDDIDNKVSLYNGHNEPIRLVIPGEKKQQILNELNQSLEINQATLFPDKENVASW